MPRAADCRTICIASAAGKAAVGAHERVSLRGAKRRGNLHRSAQRVRDCFASLAMTRKPRRQTTIFAVGCQRHNCRTARTPSSTARRSSRDSLPAICISRVLSTARSGIAHHDRAFTHGWHCQHDRWMWVRSGGQRHDNHRAPRPVQAIRTQHHGGTRLADFSPARRIEVNPPHRSALNGLGWSSAPGACHLSAPLARRCDGQSVADGGRLPFRHLARETQILLHHQRSLVQRIVVAPVRR